jgi:tetratricopeptide (TPR) repeat protein
MTVRFGVLGPVEIADDGRKLSVTRRQARCVLAILLLEPGRTVSARRLCELVWDDNPPDHALRVLRSHVSRIRAVIMSCDPAGSVATLDADHSGYVLRVALVSTAEERIRCAPPRSDRIRPAQLPPAPAGFVGRAEHVRRLRALLAGAGDDARPDAAEGASRSSVVVIVGAAGVGKSTLAMHWGHQVRGRFPDGQLYVDLRGFDPSGSMVSSAQALRGLLDALGVPEQQVPADLAQQTGLYRSLLSDKRMLILLDNAYDAEQVRPLLPAGGLTLITSRNQLSGLVARDGATPIALDVLTPEEARQMLAARLGAGRVRREPEAVDTIVEVCGRLPLALAVVAARAAGRSHHSLASVAGQLTETRGRLDAFSGEDAATDVRGVFSWSYRALAPPAARLFRLLSLHPTGEIALTAAASLSGAPPSEVRGQLAELVRTHLLTEPSPGGYALHDLLRAYASERALVDDGQAERRTAARRLLDHYVHTAYRAAVRLGARPEPAAPERAAPGVSPEPLDHDVLARRWLAAHWPVLLGAVHQAAEGGLDRHTVALAGAVSDVLVRRGAWRECHEMDRVALEAAHRLGDPAGEAEVHRRLAMAASALRDDNEAISHAETALKLFGDYGDQAGLARVHHSYSWVFYRQDRVDKAIGHAREAERLCRISGDRLGQAIALNNIGWDHIVVGDFVAALAACRRAIAIQVELDDRTRQADTLDSLGYAHHHLGQAGQALDCYRRAIVLYRETDDRLREATSLSRLADVYETAGDIGASYAARRRAVSIMAELGHPDADDLRRRLNPGLESAPMS